MSERRFADPDTDSLVEGTGLVCAGIGHAKVQSGGRKYDAGNLLRIGRKFLKDIEEPRPSAGLIRFERNENNSLQQIGIEIIIPQADGRIKLPEPTIPTTYAFNGIIHDDYNYIKIRWFNRGHFEAYLGRKLLKVALGHKLPVSKAVGILTPCSLDGTIVGYAAKMVCYCDASELENLRGE